MIRRLFNALLLGLTLSLLSGCYTQLATAGDRHGHARSKADRYAEYEEEPGDSADYAQEKDSTEVEREYTVYVDPYDDYFYFPWWYGPRYGFYASIYGGYPYYYGFYDPFFYSPFYFGGYFPYYGYGRFHHGFRHGHGFAGHFGRRDFDRRGVVNGRRRPAIQRRQRGESGGFTSAERRVVSRDRSANRKLSNSGRHPQRSKIVRQSPPRRSFRHSERNRSYRSHGRSARSSAHSFRSSGRSNRAPSFRGSRGSFGRSGGSSFRGGSRHSGGSRSSSRHR